MALSAREIIFYVRAQNQASTVMNRIARDFTAMGSSADKAAAQIQRAEMALARSNVTASKMTRVQNDLTTLKSNKSAQDALVAAQAVRLKLTNQQYEAGTKAIRQERQMFDLGTRRLQIQQRMSTMVSRYGGVPTEGAAASKYEILQRQLVSVGMAENALTRDQTALADSTARLKGQIALATTEMRRMQAAVNFNQLDQAAIAEKQAQLGLLQKQYAQQVAQAEQMAHVARQQSIDQLNRQATALHAVGRAAQLTGTILLAGAGAAAHYAAGVSSGATLAATQARRPGAPIAQTAAISQNITASVMRQMQEFPATAQDMNDAFYQVFSGTNVQNVQKAAGMIRVFNEAAVGGAASLHDMTEAGITIFNNFPGEFKNMTGAMNTFFAAVRYGRMNVTQFANALPYIANISKDVGGTFKGIASDMAFFTRQTGGRLTRQDAQGYARLLQLFARDDVTKGLGKKGIDVFDKMTGKMRPIVTILGEIHDKMHLTPQETINFFKTISALGSGKSGTQGTIQALRIFSTGINNMKEYKNVSKDVGRDTDEMVRSFQAMQQTPGVKWAEFVNQLKVMVYTIGVQAIPAFVKLSQPIITAIKWFNGLSNTWKHIIALTAVFGGAFLLIGGTMLSLISSVVRLRAALITIQGAKGLAGVATEASAASGASSTLLANLTKLGAIGVIAVSVVLYIKYHKQITDAINGVISKALGEVGINANTSRPNNTYAEALKAAKAAAKAWHVSLESAAKSAMTSEQFKRFKQSMAPPIDENAALAAAKMRAGQGKITAAATTARRTAIRQGNANEFNAAYANYTRLAKLENDVSQHSSKYTVAQRTKIYQQFYAAQDRLQKATSSNQYQAIVQAVNDEYQAVNSAEKKKVSAAQKAANKRKAIAKQAADATSAYESQALQALQSKYTEFLQANQQAFGQLFSGPTMQGARFQNMVQWGMVDKQGRPAPRPQDLISDIKSQVTQFAQFRQGLAFLQKAGAPAGLIAQVQGMGTDAAPELAAFQKMTKAQLALYIRTWKAGHTQIKAATQVDFKPEVKKWRLHGREIAKAIAQGIQDEDFTLFKNLKREILADLRGTPIPSSGKTATSNDFSTTTIIHGEPSLSQQVAARHAAFAHRAKIYGRPD